MSLLVNNSDYVKLFNTNSRYTVKYNICLLDAFQHNMKINITTLTNKLHLNRYYIKVQFNKHKILRLSQRGE